MVLMRPGHLRSARSRRIALVTEILAREPLPAGALVKTLNRRLREEGHPAIALRMLQLDLRWLREQMGHDAIVRIPRTHLAIPPPAALRGHRWFYQLVGPERILSVASGVPFLTDMELVSLQVAKGLLAEPAGTGTGPAGGGPLADAINRLIVRLGLDRHGLSRQDVIAVHLQAPQRYAAAALLEVLRAMVMSRRPWNLAEGRAAG